MGDRKNMVYAGTAVTYGRGRALVVATGMQTEFGKIAQLLQTVETGKTPLQENLDKVGTVLARAAFVVVAIIVALGLLRGQPFIDMLIFGIALAVAVVPEALPAVVTISLAIGVQRMVKRNALIRRLPAVETLGSTSVICSDKTGTLTKDEMTVRKIYIAGQLFEVSRRRLCAARRVLHQRRQRLPTAQLSAARDAAAPPPWLRIPTWCQHDDRQAGISRAIPPKGRWWSRRPRPDLEKSDLDASYPRVHEIPFTSETKRMTTLHQTGRQPDRLCQRRARSDPERL